MKRSVALALLLCMGIFLGSAAIISPAMADCGTCDASDASKEEKPCPACEKNKNKEKCPACEAKKKKDKHEHEH